MSESFMNDENITGSGIQEHEKKLSGSHLGAVKVVTASWYEK